MSQATPLLHSTTTPLLKLRTHPRIPLHTTLPPKLDPQTYSLRYRLRLHNVPPQEFMKCITHKSYAQVVGGGGNERVNHLGEKILQFYTTEFLHYKYPNLPLESIQALTEKCVGEQALGSVAKTLGLHHVMRWTCTAPETKGEKPGEHKVAAGCLKAIVGMLYQSEGAKTAKDFIKVHFLHRTLNLNETVQLSRPKRLLSALLARNGQERPITRLLKESGRLSKYPIFVVGIYSGDKKLSEAYGTSLKIAEARAARSALLSHFLSELDLTDVKLPSEAEEDDTTFLRIHEIADTPPII